MLYTVTSNILPNDEPVQYETRRSSIFLKTLLWT